MSDTVLGMRYSNEKESISVLMWFISWWQERQAVINRHRNTSYVSVSKCCEKNKPGKEGYRVREMGVWLLYRTGWSDSGIWKKEESELYGHMGEKNSRKKELNEVAVTAAGVLRMCWRNRKDAKHGWKLLSKGENPEQEQEAIWQRMSRATIKTGSYTAWEGKPLGDFGHGSDTIPLMF